MEQEARPEPSPLSDHWIGRKPRHEHKWTEMKRFVRLETVWRRRMCNCGAEEIVQATLHGDGYVVGNWLPPDTAIELRRSWLEHNYPEAIGKTGKLIERW